jgi:hypothetical protein
VVFNKNQNVKAGINKLRRYLGAHRTLASTPAKDGAGGDVPVALGSEESVIAVSAQGEGSIKLVGIVDMVKRITGEKPEGAKEDDGVKWCMYTVLSSVIVPRKKVEPVNVEELEKEQGEPMDIDHENGAAQVSQDNDEEETKTKTAPVLTVWMTRKRIPSFKDVFGEQEFVVYKAVS